jgi:uncharacterized SAM-binding protein YcdF (DUF218 family)
MNADIETREPIITSAIEKNAETLWNYHCLYEESQKSDFIVVTGHDARIVKRAIDLYVNGYSEVIVASGSHKYGEIRGFDDDESKTEAETYRLKLIELGVPPRSILIQDRSKNAGEVFSCLKELFKAEGLNPLSGIFVYEPHMQRRGRASLDKQWPELESIVTSIEQSFEEYADNSNGTISRWKLIDEMVKDMWKIIEYPAKGFQTEQDIPDNVLEAYEKLRNTGFNVE